MDVPGILLYCFYACLQMYFLMFVGLLSVWKKILDEKKSAVFSKVVFTLIIPLFQIVQISSAGTFKILALLWIIIVNFVLAMVVAYVITILFQKILKLEYRIRTSFAGMCSFPAMGALPLVIGNGYCFPGGPIESDPFCKDFFGVMVLSSVVLNYALFVVGYLLILADKTRNDEISTKMKYIWHTVISKIYIKNQTVLDIYEDFIPNTNKAKELFDFFEEKNKITAQKEETDKLDYIEYYNLAFDFVKSYIQIDRLKEFKERKELIISNLNQSPSIFPTSAKIYITDAQAKTILDQYSEWEKITKAKDPRFELKVETTGINLKMVLKSIISPPTTAFFLGMILAISRIREFMYDGNKYWSNLLDGFQLIISNLTTFIFVVIGVACFPKPNKNQKRKHLLINKVHIIFIFIIRFIVIPFIGILVIYFWKKVYGNECADSPVFRLVLFFPWCLPSSTTFSVLVTMTDYFFEEYGLLALLQNFSCIITLTLLNLIYFIIVGLEN